MLQVTPMRHASLLLMTLLALSSGEVWAQNPAGTPARIRGTVATLDGLTLVVAARGGGQVSVMLRADTPVRGIVKASLADIKENSFVGIAAKTGPGGKLEAEEVVVFPEAARGAGEGHYDWDLTPGDSMTNATVMQVVALEPKRLLKLHYKGGDAEIEVAPGVPIVSFVPADKSLLKPGAAVFLRVLKQPDGSVVPAGPLIAEKDGVKPPM
jgi:hypothetical protein